jgi:hypothetical protein
MSLPELCSHLGLPVNMGCFPPAGVLSMFRKKVSYGISEWGVR